MACSIMSSCLERFFGAFTCLIITLMVSISLNIWFYSRGIQPASKHRKPTVQISSSVVRTSERRQSEIIPGWWTDVARFQIERRAIFGKVPSLQHGAEHGLIRIDLALCKPPWTLRETWRLYLARHRWVSILSYIG